MQMSLLCRLRGPIRNPSHTVCELVTHICMECAEQIELQSINVCSMRIQHTYRSIR